MVRQGYFSGQLSMCLCQTPQEVASPKHFDAAGLGLRLLPSFGAQMERPKSTGSGPPPAPLAAPQWNSQTVRWGYFRGMWHVPVSDTPAEVASPKHFDAAGPGLR